MSYRLTALQALRGTEPISDLAKRSLVSDRTIIVAETGGVTRRPEVDRIVAALGTDLSTIGATDMGN